jgi:hypothetical protein
MEQRQAGSGEYFVDKGVTLLALLFFVRPVVELDTGERGKVIGAHEQEIDVLAADAVECSLAFSAFRAAFHAEDR